VAKALSINIQGLRQTIFALEQKADARLKEIDMEMAAGVEQMATTAKSIFSSNNTEIRNSIKATKIRPYQYQLSAGDAGDPMAAYIEFGTGRYFPQYPGKEAEWQALAREYYVNGEGWMRPAPYFYPSVKSGLVSLQSNIKQVLKRNERL
jgi:hypothetical protein